MPIVSAIAGLIFSGTSAKTAALYGLPRPGASLAAIISSIIGISLNVIIYLLIFVFPVLPLYFNSR